MSTPASVADASFERSSTETPVLETPLATPFTMVTGDASAMVCEGDACVVPGTQPTA